MSYHCARRYGFHATLKPPFRLKEGYKVEELERALRAFVTAWPSCPIGPLKLDLMGGFFGLVPVNPIPTSQGLPSASSKSSTLRAPLSQRDFQRRLCSQLNEPILSDGVTRTFSISSAST
ncbi:DUF1045 domain-containing protein [Bradyrhizobium centrosematis]|uniref:DUF1045 domain-containing protein n=1 Tax=Bradyrhizobium centrosematis TaxID=1300039 RepID=UPI0035B5D5A8